MPSMSRFWAADSPASAIPSVICRYSGSLVVRTGDGVFTGSPSSTSLSSACSGTREYGDTGRLCIREIMPPVATPPQEPRATSRWQKNREKNSDRCTVLCVKNLAAAETVMALAVRVLGVRVDDYPFPLEVLARITATIDEEST